MTSTRPTPARILILSGCALSLAAGACQQEQAAAVEPPPPTVTRTPPPWDTRQRPVAEVLSGGTSMLTPGQPPELLSRTRLAAARSGVGVEPTVLGDEPGELIRLKFAAKGASAPDVIRTLLGEYLGRDYVVDPGISGSITMDIDQEMTRADVLDLVGGLCALYGWALEDRDGVLFIRKGADLPQAEAPILQARAAMDSDLPAIRVRTLNYISAEEAGKIVTPFKSAGGLAVASGRTLILADTTRRVNRLADLLAAMDVPEFHGTEIWTYRLSYRRPEDAKVLLETITGATNIGGAEPLVAFVPMTGTDKLLVISRDPSVQTIVRDLIGQVDQAPSRVTRARYLYRVQHYDPAELKKLLSEVFAEHMETPNSDSGGVRLTIDPVRKLLIVTATPYDYEQMIGTIRAVDRPPQQVHVRSIILEVGLTGALQYGVEYFLQALDRGSGILELAGATQMPVVPTASAFFVATDGLALITALQNESSVRILSQPRFLVADEAEFEFQVGGEVPIVEADIDSQTQTEGTTGIRRQIEYRDTGVILNGTADINESGLVTFNITQEVTDVGNETELGPEFTTRKITTTAVVPHGHTLLLGGITREEKRRSTDKIPILGDIPLLGLAFQGIDNSDARVELMLAITPEIVNNPRFDTNISRFIQRAAGVETALREFAEELPGGPFIYTEDPSPAPDPAPQEGAEQPAPPMPDVLRQLIDQAQDAEPAPDPGGSS